MNYTFTENYIVNEIVSRYPAWYPRVNVVVF
jgi:hypothetical protein